MADLKAQMPKFSNIHTIVGMTDTERRVIGEWYLTNAKIKEIPDIALGVSLETEESQIFDKSIRLTPNLPRGVRKLDKSDSLEENKYVRQGIGILATLLGQLDRFSDPIVVEPVKLSEDLHEINLKCQNEAGENILLDFVSGDGFNIPSSLTFVKEDSIRHCLIRLINSGFKNRVEVTQVPLSEKWRNGYRDKFDSAYGFSTDSTTTDAAEIMESTSQIEKKIEELTELKKALTGNSDEANESLSGSGPKLK